MRIFGQMGMKRSKRKQIRFHNTAKKLRVADQGEVPWSVIGN